MRKFQKVLVANRGEIAIRIIRACQELGIRTVAIYADEDRLSLFRTKADEAYLIEDPNPVGAYLNMDTIIKLAKKKNVDAIHPGYGFLAENPVFARRCEEAGIAFIGPTAEMMMALGDKIQSKLVAKSVGVPTIPGVEEPITSDEDAIRFAKVAGYPVMLKAAAGGGGRGMRIVRKEEKLLQEFHSARSEAAKAFGNDSMFIEKYVERPKHIEVQVLGDSHGNLVHLYERDCSIQRRHQKLVEFTPSLALTDKQREAICADALRIAGAVHYRNAGTVEFLVDAAGDHYFIEMNPRIQVEHTVTELVTGIDLVQSQLLVAQGYELSSPEVGIANQAAIQPRGFAIQCRVTTEDPQNSFAPDTGQLDVYRTGSGFGIRLDGGNGFAGSVITPYYDSLLVKISAYSRTFNDTRRKAIRAIRESKIEGVKTNQGFLLNVLNHPRFIAGKCDTGFIDGNPSLFDFQEKKSDERKLLQFLAEKIVNETHGKKPAFDVPVIPEVGNPHDLSGTKQLLDQGGPQAVVNWIKDQKKLLLTDTTFRDAHQSLMATRVRSRDMIKIARATSTYGRDLFSVEMWGGATYDVSYRFLKESPWERLDELRKRMPNVMFQMLLRGSNAVGYKNYPDNVIREFVKEAADHGIDVFRIFDSLNWLEGMKIATESVLEAGKIAEVCMCYTGDILNPDKTKYDLAYYISMAKEIEATGAHILGIKDMSALLKPAAAYQLVKALKQEISIPIHLHTHDTSGNGVATVLMAAMAGVDIVDSAVNGMSGLTSQPALNSIVAALENTERDTGIVAEEMQQISDYWVAVRDVYAGFESDLKSGTAEIYKYEIPGGQYSNLKPQVESFGLGHRFAEVKGKYIEANKLFGDIIKVTPSSKAVGDMAIFMVQNELDAANIYDKGTELAFPDSVVDFFKGMMGQPVGGFDKALQNIVLKGEEPILVRPGQLLEAVDFDAIRTDLAVRYDREFSMTDLLSAALYPKVFEDFLKFGEEYGDFIRMESDVFFHGLREGEEARIDMAKGKSHMVKLVGVSKIDEEGMRQVVFEVDGFRREVGVEDKNAVTLSAKAKAEKADPENQFHIGAGIPGKIIEILVKEGDSVSENQPLLIVEAMKMETQMVAPFDGAVSRILIHKDQQVESGELLMELAEGFFEEE
ncbi:pyruvate carboxylase [Gottschalkiaceae bacterium SANA]|nr:pyruvate carboxylase [Gottschalkiaceae bacterium SANA]